MGTSKSVVGGETAVSANETCGTENLQWNTHPVCKQPEFDMLGSARSESKSQSTC